MTMYDQGIDPSRPNEPDKKRSFRRRHPVVFYSLIALAALFGYGLYGTILNGGKSADDDASVATATASANSAPAKKATPHVQTWGEGTYEVGTDIKPGKYRSLGQAEDSPECYWARLKSANDADIISNNASSGPQIVVILPTDKYFMSTGCAPWKRAS